MDIPGDALMAEPIDGPNSVQLQPAGGEVIFHEVADFEMTFITDADDRVIGCVLPIGDKEVLGLEDRMTGRR